MEGNLFAIVQQRNQRGGDTKIHYFADESVGDTVEATLELNVVVDAHFGLLPLGIFIRCGWQGTKGWTIQRFEETPATHLLPLQEAIIHFLE